MTDDDEQELCLQCGWVIEVAEMVIGVIDICPDCGEAHMVGIVHFFMCARDLAAEVPKEQTQKRRAGAMGLN